MCWWQVIVVAALGRLRQGHQLSKVKKDCMITCVKQSVYELRKQRSRRKEKERETCRGVTKVRNLKVTRTCKNRLSLHILVLKIKYLKSRPLKREIRVRGRRPFRDGLHDKNTSISPDYLSPTLWTYWIAEN